jgi:hypothetical protein
LVIGTVHATLLDVSNCVVVKFPPTCRALRRAAGFSLIEMVGVIAILVTLMSAGVRLLNGTGSQSRKAGTDLLSGLIEQARTTAITSRSHVILAIAEPGDLPDSDERCRISLFRVDEEWPDAAATPAPLKCTQLNRWQTLNTGVVLLPGNGSNPLDQNEITIVYGGDKNLNVKVHALAFNSRGGLHYPAGSAPVEMRIAEGGYRGGAPKPNLRAGQTKPTENRLKIGRITARPYQIGG